MIYFAKYRKVIYTFMRSYYPYFMEYGLLKPYEIIPPAIPSAGVYFFTTNSGVKYEVIFGRKKDNILHATIVFGVINEEYEGEEYVETNKGEVYRVMSTLVKIVRMYMTEHPNVHTYQFTGIAKKGETDEGATARTNLYKRYLSIIFHANEGWMFKFQGSNVIVTKKEER
jgi:hypothetical protein